MNKYKKFSFLLSLIILLLAVEYAVADQRSITLPVGTQVKKLAYGHYLFVTPDGKRVEVKGFDAEQKRFTSLSAKMADSKRQADIVGQEGKIIQYSAGAIKPDLFTGGTLTKKDYPFIRFPMTLSYQTLQPARSSLSFELSKDLKIEDKVEIARRGYFLDFNLGQERFLVYQEQGLQHRLACKLPCPISRDIIKAKYKGVTESVQAVTSFAGIDVVDRLKPVTIHLTNDAICNSTGGYGGGASGPASISNGGGSTICIWWYEKDDANMDNTYGLRNNELVIHEYTELLFTLRTFTKWHPFIIPIAAHLARDGEYSNACSDVYSNPDFSERVFYNLCNDYGFNFDRLDDLLHQIDIMQAAGEGNSTSAGGEPQLDDCQVKYLIDGIVGADTCTAFRNYSYGSQLTGLDACCPP